MRVGADIVDRNDVADVFAVEIAAIASVAARAVLRVKFFALRAKLVVDPKRIFGWLLGKQPLLDPRDLFQMSRDSLLMAGAKTILKIRESFSSSTRS